MVYSSKSGNTQKIAEAIASELNCQCLRIPKNNPDLVNLDDFDLIYLGTGIHFGGPNNELADYLKSVDLKQSNSFVIFITWGGAGKTDVQVFSRLRTILESKNQKVITGCFKCFGGRSFTFAKRGHPNQEDLKAARAWARKTACEYSSQ